MTPNLTRLFELAKQEQYQYRDGYTIITDAAIANRKIESLMKTHGEALIAALEAILAADERGQGLPYAEAMQRAAKLLAQLEVEAHNG